MGLFGRRRQKVRPLIQISEQCQPASSPGPGVRSCVTCGRRWRSVLGELRDTGELDRLMSRGECRVYASWDETIGLTCRGCRQSLCMDHTPRPRTTSEVPQASDYPCPHCGHPMDHG